MTPADPLGYVEEEEEQCARCGSSLYHENCETCSLFGHYDQADPDCPACHGTGTVVFCMSGYDWCQKNPRPGREEVEPGTVETFKVRRPS